MKHGRAHLGNLDKLVVVVMPVEERLLAEHHACTHEAKSDAMRYPVGAQSWTCFLAVCHLQTFIPQKIDLTH